MSKEKKAVHAANRLTFGARQADLARIASIGVEKWIEQQLHPEQIPENPVLAAKLAPLDSLRMSSEEMALNYPPPQLLRAISADKRLLASLPAERREELQRLAERYQRQRQRQSGEPAGKESVADLLDAQQRRILQRGSQQEREKLLESMDDEQLSRLVEAMPQNLRRGAIATASPELRRKILKAAAPAQLVPIDLMEGKLYRALYSERQLEEVLVDFWYNHFNVHLDKGADRYLVTSYERDAIRPHVLGKFKDMVLATARHPAMLFYLDNWQSVDPKAAERVGARGRRLAGRGARGLNENYGRELLELHTLGVDGGYTQNDVIEVARCFTGWTIDDPRRGGTFRFNRLAHDPGEKIVLGVKIPAGGGVEDGEKVIELLSAHPSTARYISWKLAQRFVADDPPQQLVDRMATVFRKSGGDLRQVMRAMLFSKEFFSEAAWRAKVKSPLEFVVGAARATGAEVSFAISLAAQIEQLGQPLYRKVEPTGYSNTGEEWVSTASLLGRMNFASALSANRLPGVKVEGSQWSGLSPVGMARQILGFEPSGSLQEALNREGAKQGGGAPLPLAALVLGSPDFQRR